MDPIAILYALALAVSTGDTTPARPFVASLGIEWKAFTKAVNSHAHKAVGLTIGSGPTLGRLVDIASALTAKAGISGPIPQAELAAVLAGLKVDLDEPFSCEVCSDAFEHTHEAVVEDDGVEIILAPVAQAPALNSWAQRVAEGRVVRRADGTIAPAWVADLLADING